MSLRSRYFAYLILVHAAFAALAILLLGRLGPWFFAVEAFFIFSLIVGIVLGRRLFEPIRLIRNGVELIEANEFATRFREVGQAELDPLIHVYNKMADRLREERIRNEEQEHFLRKIIANSPTGVVALDLDGKISMCNRSAAVLLKREQASLPGRRFADLQSPFAEMLAELETDEARILLLQGSRRVRCRSLTFMDRGFARTFLLMDELTEELHRSEKMAYEKLIRVMSHEVNNTTGAVSSLLDSCLAYREQIDDKDREDFVRALTVAISRTGRMNRFMQEFAEVVRLPAPRKQACDLRRLIEEISVLFREESEERGIQWRWEWDSVPMAVDLDPVQMEQALINILKNSMEAIGENGVITIRLSAGGDRPSLVIEDTGGGIPPQVRENLFTPFYSSKENGQGIGLTLVREVLLRHGFDFSLESTAPGRTEFTIRF